MINARCKTCGVQLPIRSPAVECKQCRYKRGTVEVYTRLMGLLADGIEAAFDEILVAFHQGTGRGKPIKVKGTLADCLRGR